MFQIVWKSSLLYLILSKLMIYYNKQESIIKTLFVFVLQDIIVIGVLFDLLIIYISSDINA